MPLGLYMVRTMYSLQMVWLTAHSMDSLMARSSGPASGAGPSGQAPDGVMELISWLIRCESAHSMDSWQSRQYVVYCLMAMPLWPDHETLMVRIQWV